MNGWPSAAELLATPGALLTRSHLAELGLGRAAIDAIFRELDVVVFPGSSRPHVRVADYLALVERSTYGEAAYGSHDPATMCRTRHTKVSGPARPRIARAVDHQEAPDDRQQA